MSKKARLLDKQAPLSGKVENDFNKQGEQRPTQRNEPRRSPASRSDRESQLGSDNQTRARRGSPNSGQGNKQR